MALKLLAVLLALLLARGVPTLLHLRSFGWLKPWLRATGATRTGIVLAVLLPAALAGVVSYVLLDRWLGVLWLAFALVTLLWTLGPRELEADLEELLNAAEGEMRATALQNFGDGSDTALAWSAPSVVGAGINAALRRRYAVLFWFFILGPGGALLYRLARLAAGMAGHAAGLPAAQQDFARRMAAALEWPAALLMVLAMALVSNFDAVLGSLRAWHNEPGRSWLGLDPDFLPAIAVAGVNADVEAGDGYAVDATDVAGELEDLAHLLNRVLLVWLVLAALLVLGGWMA
ncbi:beta-lactamase induction protein [Metallibacterium scheffleri]|jgi:AmpE protein